MEENNLEKSFEGENSQEQTPKKKKRIKIRLVHFIVFALILVIIALVIVIFSMVKYVLGTMSLYMKYKNYNEGMTSAIELLGKTDEFEEAKAEQEQKENEEYIVEIDRTVRKSGKEKREKLASKGNMNIDDEIVQELYNTKLLKANSIAYDYEGSFYKNSKTTVKDLSNQEKNVAILQYLEWQEKEYTDVNTLSENEIKKLLNVVDVDLSEINLSETISNLKIFSEVEIKNAMIEIFGKEIDVEFESFHGCAEDFAYIDGKYYFYDFPGGGYGDLNYGLGQIQYVIKKNDYIYIYDKFAYRRDMDFEVEYKEKYAEPLNAYYASSDDTVPIGIDCIDVVTNYDEGQDAEIYELYNDLHLYKHTFKKGENDSYYWVSTEIEEK